jgi:hypothetical protein
MAYRYHIESEDDRGEEIHNPRRMLLNERGPNQFYMVFKGFFWTEKDTVLKLLSPDMLASSR